MILETRRLILRELTRSDINDLAELLQDADVMYAYEHTFTWEDVRQWLERQLERYRACGFGLWAAVLKSTGELIGQAGLTIQPCGEEEVLEIGYLLKKKFWHCGYATEAANACKAYAFKTLRAGRVCSIIKFDNLPSIRVAERIGMTREKEFPARYYNGDVPHFLYSIKREKE